MSYSIVELFEEKTQYKLSNFLNKVSDFIKKDYPTLIEFYSVQKNLGFNIKNIVIKLDDLHSESNTVLSIIQNNSDSLDSRFWELVEMLDEIKLSLEYMKNTPKWLRSVISKGKYSYSFENVEMLKQRETLENLSTRLGSSDRDNDWIHIALRNNLSEEQYTPDGGINLVVQYFNKLSLTLNTVIDSNIVGEKVYGKDLNKKIAWVDDDIDVLSYKGTVVQSVENLCKLKMGDNPEFPEDGIPATVVVGGNRNSIPMPILKRQIQQTFQKDDTLKSLLISKAEIKGDSISLSLQVETRINEVIEQSI